MRLMVSRLTDTVTVHAGDRHVAIAPGAVVDFDEHLGAATLESHMGHLAASFAPHEDRAAESHDASEAPVPESKPSRRRSAPTQE